MLSEYEGLAKYLSFEPIRKRLHRVKKKKKKPTSQVPRGFIRYKNKQTSSVPRGFIKYKSKSKLKRVS